MDFLTAMLVLLWLINDKSVLLIPIPAMTIALTETKFKKFEKLSMTLLKLRPLWPGRRVLILSS